MDALERGIWKNARVKSVFMTCPISSGRLKRGTVQAHQTVLVTERVDCGSTMVCDLFFVGAVRDPC